MKCRLDKRGATGCRYDLVLEETFAGLPGGEVIGQLYVNDEGKRKPNPNRQILALKIVQALDSVKS